MQHKMLDDNTFFLVELDVKLLAENFHHNLILGSGCKSSELFLSIGLEFGYNIITSDHSVDFHFLSKFIKKFVGKIYSNDGLLNILRVNILFIVQA